MDVEKRIRLSRIAEKVDKNKKFACKIGIKNNSKFDTKRGGYKC